MIKLRSILAPALLLLSSPMALGQSMAPVPLERFSTDHLEQLRIADVRSLLSRPDQLSALVKPRPELDYVEHTVEPGESYSSILGNAGLNADQRLMFRRLTERHDLLPHPGDLVVLGYDRSALHEAWLWQSDHQALRIALVDGRVSVSTVSPKFDTRVAYVFGYKSTKSFLDSLASTDLPRPFINEYLDLLVGTHSSLTDVPMGSDFSMVFEQVLVDGRVIGVGRLLVAGLNESAVVRYKDYTGVERYFDPKGVPQTSAISRRPVQYTRVTSRFNPNRRHPILKRYRPHNGVDYAAPEGTPVKAAGRGRVRFAGHSEDGYGNLVVLSHPDGLKTKYAHLSRFAKDLKSGDFVEQGEVIGHVGQSGLATGPHLHFEILADGTPVNPLTAELPTAEPLNNLRMRRFNDQALPVFARLNRLNRFSAIALQYKSKEPQPDYRSALLASLSGESSSAPASGD